MHEPLTTTGVLRKLWIGEADKYRDHLLRLDTESRHSRFGMGVSDTFIEAYVDTALSLDAVVHGFFVDGVLRGAAELRPLGPQQADAAEVAFSVEKGWQAGGIGTTLMGRTILAARNRGLTTLYMSCLSHNRSMQKIARKFEAELSFDRTEASARLSAPLATPLSWVRELFADGSDFTTAALDVQSRMLRPV